MTQIIKGQAGQQVRAFCHNREVRPLQQSGNKISLRRLSFTSIASVAVLVVLWWLLNRVLASSRGLDLSDEGLYLLAADPPSPSASWGFPSGWHTHPLFALVGYDIASFRTLGAVVLFVAFAWLGWASVRVVTAARELTTTQRQFLLFTGVLVGGLGSLFYYAPMLRTPSYNWLNLVGIAISAAAAPRARGWRRRSPPSSPTCSA